MKGEILLFQPEVPVQHHIYLPYSLLPVAGVLERAGYRVQIIDTRFEDYTKVDLNDAIFWCRVSTHVSYFVDNIYVRFFDFMSVPLEIPFVVVNAGRRNPA